MLDEHQIVRPGELGNVNDIEKAARARGLDVHAVNLNAQFRCGGSDSYVEWVERLLGLRMGGPTQWRGDPRFSVQVADTPSALEAALAAKLAERRGARMAAGYCWPWSDPRTGRVARIRRLDRGVVATVEPQRRSRVRRRTASGIVGQ